MIQFLILFLFCVVVVVLPFLRIYDPDMAGLVIITFGSAIIIGVLIGVAISKRE